MESLHSIVDLYRYIQSYLTDEDYFAWMNCNQNMVSFIKRETIKYTIKAEKVDEKKVCNAFTILYKMMKHVVSPSKQISLDIKVISMELMLSLSFNFRYLQSLYINTRSMYVTDDLGSDFSALDIEIFNNIPIVSLHGFRGVTKIMSGFQKVQELTLDLIDLTEIYDLITSNQLHEFVLKRKNIRHISSQMDISDSFLQLYQGVPEISIFVKSKANKFELSYLQIIHAFEEVHVPIHLLASVSSLDVENSSDELVLFPPFQGRELWIMCFDLTRWANTVSMPALEYLDLCFCTAPSTLPFLPRLRRLFLYQVTGLKFIQTLPVCSCLHVNAVISLLEIEPQPMLRTLKLLSCPNIRSYQSFDGQKLRSLDFSCLAIPVESLRWCRNVFSLQIKFVQFCSLTDLKDSILLATDRDFLATSTSLSCWSALHGFNSVYLINIPHISTDFALCDLSYLTISSCSSITSTKTIHNIKQRLIIDNCYNISSLEQLQNIPFIILSKLPKVESFAGLGHNEHLFIHKVPALERDAREFRKLRNSQVTHYPTNLSIFQTIKACTVIEWCILGLGHGNCFWKHISNLKQERLW